MEPFTRIERADLGKMPAMVDVSTGVLTLNQEVFSKYPRHWQRFILLHEEGHVLNRSTNEQAATDYAIDHFINGSTQEEINEQIHQLTEILSARQPDNPAAREEQKKWQAVNPNYAGFWEVVMMVLDLGAGEIQKSEEENYSKGEKEIKETTLFSFWALDEIERQRIQRVAVTYLPWITLAIIAIALIIINRKK